MVSLKFGHLHSESWKKKPCFPCQAKANARLLISWVTLPVPQMKNSTLLQDQSWTPALTGWHGPAQSSPALTAPTAQNGEGAPGAGAAATGQPSGSSPAQTWEKHVLGEDSGGWKGCQRLVQGLVCPNREARVQPLPAWTPAECSGSQIKGNRKRKGRLNIQTYLWLYTPAAVIVTRSLSLQAAASPEITLQNYMYI